MNNDTQVARISDCKVCYLPHNDEIHEATLRIRRWHHYEVTRKLVNSFETSQEFVDASLAPRVA